ncbi:MAG: hypothetical protein FGF51_04620 [Candidatus Brockarchaeota archaeon]|nr:hypothetical protein [Candidatus Brockarchaeota archaeon]
MMDQKKYEEEKHVDRVAEILRIINKYYPYNLDEGFEELSSYGLDSVTKIEKYVNNLFNALTERLIQKKGGYFPSVSDEEIREKLFPRLREYFGKTPAKLIIVEDVKEKFSHEEIREKLFPRLREYFGKTPAKLIIVEDVKEKFSHFYHILDEGEMIIHPMLVELYDLRRARQVEVRCGPVSKIFSYTSEIFDLFGYSRYLSRIEIGFLPEEPFIAFNKGDMHTLFDIFRDKWLFKCYFRADYKIALDPSRNIITIDVFEKRPDLEDVLQSKRKKKEEKLSKIDKLISEINEVLTTSTSDVVNNKLRNLAVMVIKDYGDLEMGEKIFAIIIEIKEKVPPGRSLRGEDILMHKIITTLNELRREGMRNKRDGMYETDFEWLEGTIQKVRGFIRKLES